MDPINYIVALAVLAWCLLLCFVTVTIVRTAKTDNEKEREEYVNKMSNPNV